MKRKYLIIIVCIVAAIVLLWFITRATGMLQFYTVPTSSNEPTIKTGGTVYATNVITPKRFDFICYLSTVPEHKNEIWMHRLCGLPGDTVKIIDGDLYVNDQPADKNFTLAHDYMIPRIDYENITKTTKPMEDYVFGSSADTVIFLLKDEDALHQKFNVKRYIHPSNVKDPFITAIFSKDWNIDNFGPIVVPAGHYFVLGDNRNRSQDSRFTGLIPITSLKGTVFWK